MNQEVIIQSQKEVVEISPTNITLYKDNRDRVGFSAKDSTSTTGVWSVVSFTNTLEDTHNAFNGTTFTVPITGIYGISGVFTFANVLNGNRYIVGIEINDERKNVSYILGRGTAGSSTLQGVGGHIQIPLNQGDTVKMVTYCDNPTEGFDQAGYQSFSVYKIH